MAIQDGPNHVSVVATGEGEMDRWIASRSNAESEPYYLTTVLKLISIKSGGNCNE